MSWGAIEVALRSWALVAGVPVIWGQQDGERPAAPYISLLVTNVQQVGQDWLEIGDNPKPVAGAEVIAYARGQRRVTLSVQCFAGPATGDSSPARLLEAMRSARKLPSVADALNDAGVGVLSFAPILTLGGVVGGHFEPRAAMDIYLLVTSEVSETATYIQHVQVTDQITGDVDDVDLL